LGVRLKDLRIPIIIAAMLVTLALLLGGQFLYQKYYIEQPLFKLLHETRAVKSLKFDQGQTQTVLKVEFGEVGNLKEAYGKVTETAEQVLGSSVPIRIVDHRSPELKQVFDHSQFAVYEAIMNGNFTGMAKTVEEQARLAQLDRYAVYVDRNNVYVQLHKGGNYLYEVIPRDTGTKVSGNQASLGSEQS
jgi:hypothetical protein